VAEVTEGSVVDGRYKVERRIGSGGMADVWLAEDTHLQRHVALKVLHKHFSQDREFVARFQREAEAAAGLQHPNVVAVYDRGDVDGVNYIAMQYVEGPTLKQLIDGGLTPERAVSLIRQVLEAARFAHRNGIVHRDLKPQNVIIGPEGAAMVTDFGIARAGVSEITQTGSVMGTPHYLSPEQAQGEDVTSVSDLYSIGVILYEALTGRVPFEGESAVAVAMKQVSQTPQRPSSINAQVSPALDAVVMRALEKEPGQRFQSADAFIAALDAAIREPGGNGGGTDSFAALPPVVAAPVEAESQDEEEWEERHKRRRRRILAAIAAVIVGVLIGLAVTSESSTNVPNVTGESRSAATTRLELNGFPVGEPNEVQSQAPRNTVLEQDPLPGEAEEDCSFFSLFCSKPTIKLTISTGPGSSAVPRVSSFTEQKATQTLEAAGFQVDVQRVNSSAVEEGVVINSEPAGGRSATNGSTVTINVSKGPKLIKVPVLVGAQRDVAAERIRGRGLEPSVSEEESSAPQGQVISQSPDAGSRVESGSTVSIVVSKGEKQAKMPNVIGKERREAVELVRAAGLVPVVEEEETEVTGQIGRVVDQFPPPRQQLAPGSEVTLVVGRKSAVVEPEAEEEE